MKEEKIKVLALLPMELPKEIDLDNTLEAMQKFVGGLIECITSTHPILLLVVFHLYTLYIIAVPSSFYSRYFQFVFSP